MIRTKTPEDIAKLAEAGKLLGDILTELADHVVPGTTGAQLDELARRRMDEHNVQPAFLGYGEPPFPGAVCVSVNEGVVHGVPTDVAFNEGDLVGLDCGLVYDGLYVDSAHTIPVGNISEENERLLEVTKEALRRGIDAAHAGNTVGDIGAAVQEYTEGQGYAVIRELVGHGVGYAVHEEPHVPNVGKPGKGITLQEGLVIAIEPMITTGKPKVATDADNWTVVTKSGAPAAHEEHTIAITKDGPRILTAQTQES